jgi:hypothetical protein
MTVSSLDNAAVTILKLAKNQWDEEEATDFSTLRRIPSASVCRFLAYYHSLALADRVRWTHLRLKYLPSIFLPAWKLEYSQEELEQLRQHADSIGGRFFGWQTVGLRTLKLAISWSEYNRSAINIDWMPPEAIEWLQNTATAKANLLRRLIKPAFKQEFGLTAENQGGGEWTYGRSGEDGALLVSLDFGGRGSQLRYDVRIQNKTLHVDTNRLSFETLLGVTCIGWDWITEDSAAVCVSLLIELIRRVIDFSMHVGQGIEGERRTQQTSANEP